MYEIEKPIPMAYFITFTCYGTWLHGGKDISVDKNNNEYTEKFLSINVSREESIKRIMLEPAYLLGEAERNIVLSSIEKTCLVKSWRLLAAHVRSNHIHLVLESKIQPEKILSTIKAYATRDLKLLNPNRSKFWTRHGSTRYLWKEFDVEGAIKYVVYEQGDPMAVFEDKTREISIEAKYLIWSSEPRAPASGLSCCVPSNKLKNKLLDI